MKQQVVLPVGFVFSLSVTCLMVGAMIGSVVTYALLNANQDFFLRNKISPGDNVVCKKKVAVVKVVDGDTIVVKLDEKTVTVSYLGIDAPEEKEGVPVYYTQESSQKNRELVEGKEVILIWDSKQMVPHRLLAYVFVDDIFVNAELLRGGYAAVYRRSLSADSSKHLYSGLFNQLEQEARVQQLGIWNQKEKIEWEREQKVERDRPSMYISDGRYFHRPDCVKVKDIVSKSYYYARENAIRDGKLPCTFCKP